MLFGELSQITGPELCVGRNLNLYLPDGCLEPSTGLGKGTHECVRVCIANVQDTGRSDILKRVRREMIRDASHRRERRGRQVVLSTALPVALGNRNSAPTSNLRV